MSRSQLLIAAGAPSRRLDLQLLELLREKSPDLSRAALRELFKERKILVNGRPATAALELPPGNYEIEILAALETGPVVAAAAPSEFLPVVYEDDEIFVLNKRTGVPSVPQAPDEPETACGSALARHPELAPIGRGGLEPGILHRLDTGTSGLIVFARKDSAFSRLKEAWKTSQVRKTYRAVVRAADEEALQRLMSALPSLPIRIDTPMGHDPKSSKRMVVVSHPGVSTRGPALNAVTWIRAAHELKNGLWDFEIEIETGVMHQIRCHLASIGFPLQGDSVYRGTPSHRLWLHAWKLELPLSAGGCLKLQSALPEAWPVL